MAIDLPLRGSENNQPRAVISCSSSSSLSAPNIISPGDFGASLVFILGLFVNVPSLPLPFLDRLEGVVEVMSGCAYVVALFRP